MDQLESNQSSLIVTPAVITFLSETARWAKFISIVGFVGMGFMVIMGLFAGSLFSMIPEQEGNPAMTGMMQASGAFLGIFYIIIAVVYFFPLYYLFQFSTKIKRAFQTNDQPVLEQSFEYLKSHYKFIGIMVVIMLGLYALLFLIMVLFGGLGLLLGS